MLHLLNRPPPQMRGLDPCLANNMCKADYTPSKPSPMTRLQNLMQMQTRRAAYR